MTKLRKLSVLLLVVLVMAGCGNRTDNAEPTKAPTEEDLMIERMSELTAMDVVSQMKIGWNLGNTMDATNSSALKMAKPSTWETAWGNPVTSEELIAKIIDEGFNVVRIPVSWVDHILPGGEYKIEEKWMNRVQELVDYAYSRGAYVIINTHHEGWYDPYYENEEAAAKILRGVWTQIAERFKGYDEHLIFEGMNEPRKRNTSLEWNGGDKEGWEVVNNLNKVFIETVRSTGGANAYRMLMIPGYAANCTVGIRHLEVPEGDNRLIVSVHAYEPYNFALNTAGRGLWNEDTSAIDSLAKNLNSLFISKGIPVIIGEMGAMHKPVEGNEASRGEWAEYYISKMKEIGVPCVWWDNGTFEGDGELFGLIDRGKLEWKYPLVIEGLFKGLEQ
ncbi:MAG: glycoside hydrolase family 5 protein [Lachnospiraceae bacterium]|nr:glycoside hydrolase family 5 protein [Lachnospiraceae bacterium]